MFSSCDNENFSRPCSPLAAASMHQTVTITSDRHFNKNETCKLGQAIFRIQTIRFLLFYFNWKSKWVPQLSGMPYESIFFELIASTSIFIWVSYPRSNFWPVLLIEQTQPGTKYPGESQIYLLNIQKYYSSRQ